MLFVHLCLTFKYLIFVEKASNRGFLPSFVLGRSHKQVAGWSCYFEIPAQNWCEHTNSLFWGMIALQTVMNFWGCFLLSATEGKILTSWRGGSFFGPNYDSNPISRVLREQQFTFLHFLFLFLHLPAVCGVRSKRLLSKTEDPHRFTKLAVYFESQVYPRGRTDGVPR